MRAYKNSVTNDAFFATSVCRKTTRLKPLLAVLTLTAFILHRTIRTPLWLLIKRVASRRRRSRKTSVACYRFAQHTAVTELTLCENLIYKPSYFYTVSQDYTVRVIQVMNINTY